MPRGLDVQGITQSFVTGHQLGTDLRIRQEEVERSQKEKLLEIKTRMQEARLQFEPEGYTGFDEAEEYLDKNPSDLGGALGILHKRDIRSEIFEHIGRDVETLIPATTSAAPSTLNTSDTEPKSKSFDMNTLHRARLDYLLSGDSYGADQADKIIKDVQGVSDMAYDDKLKEFELSLAESQAQRQKFAALLEKEEYFNAKLKSYTDEQQIKIKERFGMVKDLHNIKYKEMDKTLKDAYAEDDLGLMPATNQAKRDIFLKKYQKLQSEVWELENRLERLSLGDASLEYALSSGLDPASNKSGGINVTSNEPLSDSIKKSSKKYGVDEAIMQAIMKGESGGNINADSGVAYGAFQFTPQTAYVYLKDDMKLTGFENPDGTLNEQGEMLVANLLKNPSIGGSFSADIAARHLKDLTDKYRKIVGDDPELIAYYSFAEYTAGDKNGKVSSLAKEKKEIPDSWKDRHNGKSTREYVTERVEDYMATRGRDDMISADNTKIDDKPAQFNDRQDLESKIDKLLDEISLNEEDSGDDDDESGHMPSEFKVAGHPNLYIASDKPATVIDSRTGEEKDLFFDDVIVSSTATQPILEMIPPAILDKIKAEKRGNQEYLLREIFPSMRPGWVKELIQEIEEPGTMSLRQLEAKTKDVFEHGMMSDSDNYKKLDDSITPAQKSALAGMKETQAIRWLREWFPRFSKATIASYVKERHAELIAGNKDSGAKI